MNPTQLDCSLTQLTCIHCGQQLKSNQSQYCCWGCEAVFQLIHGRGLELINRQIQNQSSFEYLDILESSRDYVSASFQLNVYVEGVHCTSCLWILENIPQWVPGIESSHLNMSDSILTLKANRLGSFEKAMQTLLALGYRPYPLKLNEAAEDLIKKENRKILVKMGMAAFSAGNLMLLSTSIYSGLLGSMKIGFEWLSFLFFLPVVFYCAIPFYQNLNRAVKTKRASIDLPIVIAIVIGFCLSTAHLLVGSGEIYYDSLSILVFLLLSTRYFLRRIQQQYLQTNYLSEFIGNSNLRLFDPNTKITTLVHNSKLQPGDLILVEQDEILPVDGKIQYTPATINPSLLTGESLPQYLKVGQTCFAGTKLLSKNAIIKIDKHGQDTRMGQILHEVQMNLHKKSQLVSITDIWAQRFTTVLVIVAGLFFAIYSQFDLLEASHRTLALIIVACPCALAFATPLAQSLTLKKAFQLGILIKSPDIFEKLRKIRTLYFDKTGTLTQANFKILEWNDNYFSIDDKIAIANIECKSEHPIAKCITQYLAKYIQPNLEVFEYQEVLGQGVEARLGLHHYQIKKQTIPSDLPFSPDHLITTSVEVRKDGEKLGDIFLGDQLKINSHSLIKKLRNRFQIKVLTGDFAPSAEVFRKNLNLNTDEVISDLSPEQKRNLIQKTPDSMFIGDGANDSLAMAEVDVAVAVNGSMASALSASDVYLMDHDLFKINLLFSLANACWGVMISNWFISLIYNLAVGLSAIAGWINPLVAAILMPISSLIMVTNTIWRTNRRLT